MAKLYVANWSDSESYDAEMDDPSIDSEADMAEPQAVVLLDRKPATIRKLLARAYEDSVAYMRDETTIPPAKWRTEGWSKRTKLGSGRQRWWCEGAEMPTVVVILREAEVVS